MAKKPINLHSANDLIQRFENSSPELPCPQRISLARSLTSSAPRSTSCGWHYSYTSDLTMFRERDLAPFEVIRGPSHGMGEEGFAGHCRKSSRELR